MPKLTNLEKIMIIGSGPIIIGQACEFDYSGTQACKALRSLGYKIVLINSNPATIMTDPSMADATYIEPLNAERIEEIIKKERPCAILPNLGGQSGLNLCSELAKNGVLEKYNVRVIGVQVDAIERGEDRIQFKKAMEAIGIDMARSAPAYSVEEAERIAEELGYPVVVRPAYTMGGAGSGLVYTARDLRKIAKRGIDRSLIGQVLIEESVLGWEELELEVVRDSANHIVTVCYIGNIDPVGVHTGDSFCSAPILDADEKLLKRLQDAAYKIVESVQVIGGCNCQFAYNPKDDRVVIIEINPRTSRSSALASKATGFPIALVSSLLATGLNLSELPCGKFGTLDKYKPSNDYVVVKFAKWSFEKFKESEDKLGTQMKAVGEVMSLGRTYKEALQKAVRSLESGRYGLGFAGNFNSLSLDELLKLMDEFTSERQFIMYEALRKGASIEQITEITNQKPYFVQQMKELVELEMKMLEYKQRFNEMPDELLRLLKVDGFADRYIAELLDVTEEEVRNKRISANIVKGWEAVHVSGTPDSKYYFSTYTHTNTHSVPDSKRKIMILGGGPNRIGQGIEFDYCCVHAAIELRELGFETIIVNCNPETVSTDYDTSDRLYFEPLTMEDVLSIYEIEKPLGVIAQFGGQTPLNLASDLEKAGVKILGTTPDTIDLAEDRDRFRAMMDKLNIPMPESDMATNVEEALEITKRIPYPIMVRPSYVLGGRGMEVVYDDEGLITYMRQAVGVTRERPVLIDRFLHNALEAEADAISDGEDAFVPAVMEHIELAGVHSGDSACVLPSVSISKENVDIIIDYTTRIAKELNVHGLMNMQYAIEDGKVYVLEANPRASRTVPIVSKVCDIQMARLATRVITLPFTGGASPIKGLTRKEFNHYGVKESVFPFNMFHEVDPVLGPEMRSTGEVLGLSDDFGVAFYKAQEATQIKLPTEGTVLISVHNSDKSDAAEVALGFERLGFDIVATEGTYKYLVKKGVKRIKMIHKINEGSPDVKDALLAKEIQMIINTPMSKSSHIDDSYIRKMAIRGGICHMTTLAAAKVAVKGIASAQAGDISTVKSLQEYHIIKKGDMFNGK